MERQITELSLEFWVNARAIIRRAQSTETDYRNNQDGNFLSKSTHYPDTIDRLCNIISGSYTQISKGGRYPIFLSDNNNQVYIFDIFTMKGQVYFLSIKYNLDRKLRIDSQFCEKICSHFIGKVQVFVDMGG